MAIADFIDLVYQNAFYDIFATKFQELELIEPEKIKEAHLNIFNLIIYVEHIKYKLYEELESKAPKNQAVLNTLKKRKSNITDKDWFLFLYFVHNSMINEINAKVLAVIFQNIVFFADCSIM